MLLDTSKPFEANKALTRLNFLISKGAKIDLTEKHAPRTVRQNAYEHILFCLFGIEFGHSMEEVKQEIFKKDVNRELFKTTFENKLTGEETETWRSTASLTTEETTFAIERFRNYSAKNGLYLQTSQEYLDNKFAIDQEIQHNKEYL